MPDVFEYIINELGWLEIDNNIKNVDIDEELKINFKITEIEN